MEGKVECLLCSRRFKVLSLHLHYKHDIDTHLYRELFLGAEIMAKAHLEGARQSLIRYNKSEEHRAKVSEMNKTRWQDPEWRKEAIERLVERNELGSYGNMHEYGGVTLRSDAELAVAQLFDKYEHDWEYEPCSVSYQMDGKLHLYTPDFYLPALDLWVEVKRSRKDVERRTYEKLDALEDRDERVLRIIVDEELDYLECVVNGAA